MAHKKKAHQHEKHPDKAMEHHHHKGAAHSGMAIKAKIAGHSHKKAK